MSDYGTDLDFSFWLCRKVLTFANHLEGLIIFTTEAQCSQCIDTIRHGTLTGSNAKYSRHRVTMLISPMDAKLVACFVL